MASPTPSSSFSATSVEPKMIASSASASSSPKEGVDAGTGMCLCSPTTHQGSFRCKYHRSSPSSWMKRSKSMPSNKSILSPKSAVTM